MKNSCKYINEGENGWKSLKTMKTHEETLKNMQKHGKT